MTANEGQRRPTKTKRAQTTPDGVVWALGMFFFSFFLSYSYYYETAATPPIPVPLETRTLEHGYGFSGVQVRVALENPRVTRANPYMRRATMVCALESAFHHSQNSVISSDVEVTVGAAG